VPHVRASHGGPLDGAALVAAASAFPRDSIPTEDIEDRLGLDRGWVVRRTGVRRRYRVSPGERLSDLGAVAARRALASAGVHSEEVDLVILATMTPTEGSPGDAALIARAIAAPRAAAFQVGAACSGFLSAIAMATGCVESGRASTVVVVGADLMSTVIDPDDKVTAGIFGDGAGAVLMRAIDSPSRIGPCVLGADGADGDAIFAPRPTGPVRLDGHRTFRRAVDTLVETSKKAMRRAGVTIDDIDLLVPHQANGRITTAVRERLGLEPERVVDCISSYGNTTGGTLPIALAHAQEQGRLQAGSRILLAAFGAGLTWGGLVVTWGAEPMALPRPG
jgi:3-oxoacyl-[acyl-carrier-protein] synthase III